MMLREREVANILGDLCDGLDVSQAEREATLVTLLGTVLTLDQGKRLYYADISTLMLNNVDTAEAIWSVPEDGLLRSPDGHVSIDFADEDAVFQNGFFLITLICDPTRFALLQEKWMTHSDPERHLAWQRLLSRVVEPLRRLSNDPR